MVLCCSDTPQCVGGRLFLDCTTDKFRVYTHTHTTLLHDNRTNMISYRIIYN